MLVENKGRLFLQVLGNLNPKRISTWLCFSDKCVEGGSERGFVCGGEMLEWSWREHYDMLLEGDIAIRIVDGADNIDSQPNVPDDGISCVADD